MAISPKKNLSSKDSSYLSIHTNFHAKSSSDYTVQTFSFKIQSLDNIKWYVTLYISLVFSAIQRPKNYSCWMHPQTLFLESMDASNEPRKRAHHADCPLTVVVL